MKMLKISFALAVVCFFLIHGSVMAADGNKANTNPKTDQMKKWRIGYIQGGNGRDYLPVLKGVVKGLSELGWIENKEIPQISAEEGTTKFWQWLDQSVKSNYVEFVGNAFYNADWQNDLRKKNITELLKRLNTRKDLDLIIAMGTWAGQDLANMEHTTPTLVLTASDPIASGIIKSNEDSGFDHIWAHVEPFRYKRQIVLFHDIVGFKKLGVVYEDSVLGKSIAAIETINQLAGELGFEPIFCKATYTDVPIEQSVNEVTKCHEELAKQVDAVYITNHKGVDNAYMSKVLAPLYKHNIPTFSMRGSTDVRYGVLMSVSQSDFVPAGKFYAETMAQVFNGSKPRRLPQFFEDPLKIALNLKAAKTIGYDISVDIMAAADEIYETIENATEN